MLASIIIKKGKARTYILNVLVDLKHAGSAVFSGPGQVSVGRVGLVLLIIVRLNELGFHFHFVDLYGSKLG